MSVIHCIGSVFDSTFGVFLVFVIEYICICISLFLKGLAWEVSNSLALVLWLVASHQTIETTTTLLVCSDKGIREKQATHDQEYLVCYLFLLGYLYLYLYSRWFFYCVNHRDHHHSLSLLR